MGKSKKAGIAALVTIGMGVIGIFAGGGEFLNFDFSQVTIDSHDIYSTIIQNGLGIDLDEFKSMCDKGEVGREFVQYCDLID
jgi:hypothetical protein